MSLMSLSRTHAPQAPEPGRYWALLQPWVTSMSGWADSSKLLIVHDNAESILSEPEAKVCGTLVLARACPCVAFARV